MPLRRREGLQSFFRQTMLKQSGLDFLDQASDDLPEDIPWGHLYTDEEWMGLKSTGFEWNIQPHLSLDRLLYTHTLPNNVLHGNHMHIDIAGGAVKWGKFFRELDLPHQDGIQSVENSIQLETTEPGNMHQRMRVYIDKMLKRDRAPTAGPDTKPINKRKRKK